jgi:hypothetical protein
MLRNVKRHLPVWFAMVAAVSALAGCGTAGGPQAASVTAQKAPASATSTSAPAAGSATTTAASSASTSPTTPEASATAPNSSPTTTAAASRTTASTTPTSEAGATGQTTTQTAGSPTTEPCGSVVFAPSSSYLASGITAVATDCITARAVASASRPHAFDPPRPNQPVQGFTANGFTCAGQLRGDSMLALVDYRCTQGSEVVTFQRS